MMGALHFSTYIADFHLPMTNQHPGTLGIKKGKKYYIDLKSQFKRKIIIKNQPMTGQP